jgi:4-hydroxy-2-oxovalerate aldolase
MTIKILDSTLRDGSNAINFQFDRELTQKILSGLEKSGIEWIEMGHGLGLGATKKCGKPAPLSDEEYMDLAKSTLKKANFGFIILKKFGEKKDIKLAAERGARFIRIGSNITEVNQIEDYIKYAKEKGLIVFIALMKAYAVTSMKEYVKILQKLEKWGADIVTLMDSAGTMLPEEIIKYINQGKKNVNIFLGFHAHNNLQLAIANTITAIKAGADYVDVSIGGLGRSAGNAPTEILAILLEKYGWGKILDYKVLSDLNDNYIFPLIKGQNRFSSVALTFGYAGFHSSFFPIVQKVVREYPSVDYRDLVIKLSIEEKVNVTEELVRRITKDLSSE